MREQCRDCGGMFVYELDDGLCRDCDAQAYRENAEAWREP